jgi:hypothetical protein
MSRIALAVVALALVQPKAAPAVGNFPVSGRPRYQPAQPLALAQRLPRKADPSQVHKVIWQVDPMDPNPFGFIPTEWPNSPQLLPFTWDVHTIYATAELDRQVLRPGE